MLLCTLDESMKNIFGENAAQAVYCHLEKRGILKLEDMVEKPETFVDAIKDIFGETCSEIIEAFLVKDLCKRFKVSNLDEETDKLIASLDKLKTKFVEE